MGRIVAFSGDAVPRHGTLGSLSAVASPNSIARGPPWATRAQRRDWSWTSGQSLPVPVALLSPALTSPVTAPLPPTLPETLIRLGPSFCTAPLEMRTGYR